MTREYNNYMNLINEQPAIIFDLDGVLVDSVGLNWAAYNQVLNSDYGVNVAKKDLYKYVGLTLTTQVELLSKDFKINIDKEDFANKTDIIKNELFKNIEPMPGVVNLLKALKNNNFKIAIGTSSSMEQAKLKLANAKILEFFDIIITENDVVKPKPSPDVYLKCAQSLNTLPQNCVVFEDAPNGVKAAKKAGMGCIAIKTVYVDSSKLKDADLIVDSISEIKLETLANISINEN